MNKMAIYGMLSIENSKANEELLYDNSIKGRRKGNERNIKRV